MELPRRSVLLVDDDDDVREVLAETLVQRGFEVNTAENGSVALDWLRQRKRPPSVVLLDLTMPVMDGQTFLRLRKSDPALSRIPVLVISAERGISELIHSHDITGVLPKPIELDGLFALIDGLSCGSVATRSTPLVLESER
jgi:CheY-like chemotaxis protein